jgi:hypothetical protein
MADASTVTYLDEQQLRLEVKLRRELCESILRLLVDEDAEDILLNPDSSLCVKRRGFPSVRTGTLSPATGAFALGTVAAWRGTVLNHDHPILETELPLDGSRFEGVVAPVVRPSVFAIRLPPRKVVTLDDDETPWSLTSKEDISNRLRGNRIPPWWCTDRGMHRSSRPTSRSARPFCSEHILDTVELPSFDRVISIQDTNKLQRRGRNTSTCRRWVRSRCSHASDSIRLKATRT